MITIADIAEAVKDDLNVETFSEDFAAVRSYQPTYELADMGTLHVTVVPKAIAETPGTRHSSHFNYDIDIGVQKKIAATTDIDGLITLVREIAAFLARHRLVAQPEALWVGTINEPIFAPDHLEQMRQFTSVLTVTYRVLE